MLILSQVNETVPRYTWTHLQYGLLILCPLPASFHPTNPQHIRRRVAHHSVASWSFAYKMSLRSLRSRSWNYSCSWSSCRLPTPTTSRSDPAAKSLGDLKAPQRTVSPQQWLHIFAPGEPKLYNDLSLPEFSAGFLVIVQRCEDPTLQTTLLAHFHDLMVLACNYKWSVVLAFHYKVLRSIEMGLVSWGESFDVLKQPFFLPTALLPEPSPKTALKPAFKLQQALTPRHQICDAWSWHDDCSNIPCSKLHICIICKKEHQAFHCPKRKYPVPPRRQDSASTE